MANKIDKYFIDALAKFSPVFDADQLPIPDIEPDEINDIYSGENDILMPTNQAWDDDHIIRKLSDGEVTWPISDDDRLLLDGGLRQVGVDIYAFYKSYRHKQSPPYQNKWGIFYFKHAIERVWELLDDYYPGFATRKIAYEFLRQHELFHFKFDLYALLIESAIASPRYEPLKYIFRKHVTCQVEEGLANRHAWEWSKRRNIGLSDFAYKFMKLQPGAYARFDENDTLLKSELAANLHDFDISVNACRDDQALWIGEVPKKYLLRSLCPEYIVKPESLSKWINPSLILPTVSEINDSDKVKKVLGKKYSDQKKSWDRTKRKIIDSPSLMGLNFKPWDSKSNIWSVRVTDNFRAHLRPLDPEKSVWESIEFGPHKAMGHG